MFKFKWHIYGQSKLLQQIENDLLNENFHSTILLSGPKHVGKFTILKRLAQILQCRESSSISQLNACDIQCLNCKQIEAESHINTFFVKREGAKFGIEEFRILKEHLYLSSNSNYKLVLIQDIERLSRPLLNACLKVFEEPPANVKFLLTSSDTMLIPDTIISRCVLYRAQLADTEAVNTYLHSSHTEFSSEFVNDVLFFAKGRIGVAENLVVNDNLYHKFKSWLSEINYLHNSNDIASALKFADSMAEQSTEEIIEFLTMFICFYRNILQQEKTPIIADKIKEIVLALQLLRQNINLKLVLKVLFLRCFQFSSTISSHNYQ